MVRKKTPLIALDQLPRSVYIAPSPFGIVRMISCRNSTVRKTQYSTLQAGRRFWIHLNPSPMQPCTWSRHPDWIVVQAVVVAINLDPYDLAIQRKLLWRSVKLE